MRQAPMGGPRLGPHDAPGGGAPSGPGQAAFKGDLVGADGPERVLAAQLYENIFGDRFQALEESSVGGMGAVYRAIDLRTGGQVALKVLRESQGPSVERFDQEAALLKELDHPAIVRYVAHGATPRGERYLAMEWLDGETLEDRLQRGQLGVMTTVRLGRRVLEALVAAHAHGIIHRDIKPGNLFLPGGSLDRLKIIDFGIARRMFDARRITLMGSTLGTPMYMSPEQARGSARIDARADIFSLGCVMFECLTGQPPFTGESPAAVLAKICLDSSLDVAERCPGLPREFTSMLARMLAKEPDRRPSSSGALAREIEALEPLLAAAGYDEGRKVPERRRVPSPVPSDGEARVLAAVMVSWPRGPAAVEPAAAPAGASTWDGPTGVPAPRAPAVAPPLEALRAEVAPFGARLDRLLDGSMVITILDHGSPVASEQVARAALCALRLRDLLPDAAFALSSGLAPRGAALPIGDILDTGARLLFGEPPGTLCVDELSAQLLAARFEIAAGPTRHLLFEKGPRNPPRTVRGRELPFVGRDREIATLETLWDECASERVARVALVTAPAGGGKSRLREELLGRLFARGAPFELLCAAAPGNAGVTGPGPPLSCLGAALRSAAGVTGFEPASAARAKMGVHFGRALGSDRAPLAVACLGEIAGVRFPDDDLPPLGAARRDGRLMADAQVLAWLDWVEAATAASPVLILVEDAERADESSLRFVDAAVAACGDRPLFVLGFGRPAPADGWRALARGRDVLRMPLSPLTSKACQRIAAGVLGDIGDERAAWLVEGAGGRPWAVEELLRAAAAAPPRAGGGPPPGSAEALLDARLAALPPTEGRMIGAASVLGPRFLADEIATLLDDVASADVRAGLDRLVAAELVHSWFEHGLEVFAFRHALVAEAALARLSPGERRRLQGLAGRRRERPDLEAAALADHLLAGPSPAAAGYLCVEAAARALAAADAGAALEIVERALGVTSEADVRSRLRLREAQAHVACGAFGAAEAAAREALAALGGAERFEALAALAAALAGARKLEEIGGLLEGLRPPEDPESRAYFADALREAAEAFVEARDPARAEAVLARADAVARILPPRHGAQVRALRAELAWQAGDCEAAASAYEAAGKGHEAAHDLRAVRRARHRLGRLLAGLGVLEAAEDHLRKALALAERLEPPATVLDVVVELVPVLLALGRPFEARLLGERATALAERTGDRAARAAAACAHARAAMAEGDVARAESLARTGVELARGAAAATLPGALALLSRALLLQGRAREAQEIAALAHPLVEGAAPGPPGDRDEGLVRLASAEAFAAAGDLALARGVLDRACARLEERAAAVTKPEWRASLLQRLPDHARTIASRGKWK